MRPRFKGHSGRVGMVHRMNDEGASTDKIMRAGRWEHAEMVMRYGDPKDAGESLEYAPPPTKVRMWEQVELPDESRRA